MTPAPEDGFYRVRHGDRILLESCEYRAGWWFRCRGLLGRTSLPRGHGLWLHPCNSIHMFFMKFPIDAVFLDRDHHVVRIDHGIAPWRATPLVVKARSVLEMAAGTCAEAGLNPGHRLTLEKLEKTG